MSNKRIYRIQFINQEKVHEVYAHSAGPSGIPGFIEIGELIFGEKSSLLVDPSEESLKNDFTGVKRSYLPMHCVIRTDEVENQGQAKILKSDGDNKIRHFPAATLTPSKPDTPS